MYVCKDITVGNHYFIIYTLYFCMYGATYYCTYVFFCLVCTYNNFWYPDQTMYAMTTTIHSYL